MAEQTELTTQILSAWAVQMLRMTAFYHHPQELDISGWWEQITDNSSEKDTNQPKNATRIVEGLLGDDLLVLRKTPVAVELHFMSPTQSSNDIKGIPSIGNYEEECPIFLELVKKLFNVQKFPSIKRLAFGAILNLPLTTEIEQVIRQLIPYMKNMKMDPANSGEFLYRINRKRSSTIGVSGLSINRLNTWSVISYRRVSVGLDTAQSSTSEPYYACQLQLDINTSQDFTDCLPSDKLRAIFEELISMGTEIITNGDIP